MWRVTLIFAFISLTMAVDKSVIIIGSGISGYSAASKLLENGFNDVIILEAEDRIGGRINTIPYDDGFIDLGAQWVHGQQGNIIYEMTHEHFDFGTTPFDDIPFTFLLSNGTKPNQELINAISKLCFEIDHKIYTGDTFTGSFGDMFIGIYDGIVANGSSPVFKDLDPVIVKMMKETSERNINGYAAIKSWFDLSAKLCAREELAQGSQHNTWRRKGFKTVFDFISKKLPDPSQHIDIESKVQLNKKVTNIKYNINDVNNKAVITCADGSAYEAKHVIFTPSLGVLKKYHESLFTPALPEQKVLAIKLYGFGAAGKIFLEFDESFWIEEGEPFVAYQFLWLDADKEEVKAANREWMLGISAFYMVDEFPNMLEAYLGGPNIEEFEASSDEKIINDCMWAFEKFLGKTLPRPKAMIKTNWLTNENFLGAYSYPSMDAEKAGVGIQELAESINNNDGKPILLFAGSAMDEKYPGNTHAGVRTGFRAADEIISIYQ
ncbi:unnamed protein product [Chironomus riparius]|uniref:Amine oxidase domain-containing protein n=1 Tax=Chironomus riparius TaxID=315576 RepID=A0A9N9S5M5_9DIPT|nr:unnamed protein product [Chironomus riparius]